jgi:hypothetical protein
LFNDAVLTTSIIAPIVRKAVEWRVIQKCRELPVIYIVGVEVKDGSMDGWVDE